MLTIPEDLEQMQSELTVSLFPMARQWARLTQRHLGQFGVSSACIPPFIVIGRSAGGLRQVDLAQMLRMEGPSLVRLLDKLTMQGLIGRTSDETDRRANLLNLTAAGEQLHGKLEQALMVLRRKVLTQMSVEELQAVLKLYRLLTDAD